MALDAGAEEVAQVRGTFAAMIEMGEIAPAHPATAVQGDALSLPFADGTFDRVIASEVLEHIPDDTAAMRELARVLRPGGAMAVTVPRCVPEAINWALSDEYHDTPGGHVRIYRRSTLERRLSSVGLEPTGYHHAHGLHSPYWWLRCLVGPSNDTHPAVEAYHKVLVWDIVKAPFVTRTADRVLSPVIGKSLVLYLTKPVASVADLPDSRPDTAPRCARATRADHTEPGSCGMTTEEIRSATLPEVPGILTSCGRARHGPRHRGGAAPRRADPVVRGRPLRPVEPRRGGHGADRVRPGRRGRRRLPVAGAPPAPRRQLVQLLPGRRGQGPPARHERLRLPGGRRLAPPPDHRRRGVPRRALADDSRRGSTSFCARSSPTARCCGRSTRPAAPERYALLTGSSSIYHSMRCAVAIAECLAKDRPDWELAAGRLGHAVAHHPGAFAPKVEFAMDWYYPMLSGALEGEAGAPPHCRGMVDLRHGGPRRALRLHGRLGDGGRDGGVRADARRPRHGRPGPGPVRGGAEPAPARRLLLDRHGLPRARRPSPSTSGPRTPSRAMVLAADALSNTSPAAGLFRGEGLPAALDLAEPHCGDAIEGCTVADPPRRFSRG